LAYLVSPVYLVSPGAVVAVASALDSDFLTLELETESQELTYGVLSCVLVSPIPKVVVLALVLAKLAYLVRLVPRLTTSV
jgi:hypothetical protein